MRLFLFLSLVCSTWALTCYTGSKLLRMQGVGTQTEECSPGAVCYNMTASAYILVDLVKAGCSTYRCMLAKDTCISTYFQLIPVSLCCCSHDRCNVGGNPVYDSNPSSITGSGGSSYDNYNYGGSGNNNNNQGGSGYNYNYGGNSKQQTGGEYDNTNQGKQSGDGGYDYNYGSSGSSRSPSSGRKFSRQEVEDKFRDFDVDHRGDIDNRGGAEEMFQKVDAFTTPPPSRGGVQRQDSRGGRGGDEISIP